MTDNGTTGGASDPQSSTGAASFTVDAVADAPVVRLDAPSVGGPDERVDQAPGATYAFEPSVTALSDGGWLVAWCDELDGSFDIY